MKYKARPVIVDAWKIERVIKPESNESRQPAELILEDRSHVLATPEMLARMDPQKGDYYVVQEDGYVYLNPRQVFERKYEPLKEGEG